jgi:hypothetical protein
VIGCMMSSAVGCKTCSRRVLRGIAALNFARRCFIRAASRCIAALPRARGIAANDICTIIMNLSNLLSILAIFS